MRIRRKTSGEMPSWASARSSRFNASPASPAEISSLQQLKMASATGGGAARPAPLSRSDSSASSRNFRDSIKRSPEVAQGGGLPSGSLVLERSDDSSKRDT